MTRWIESLPSLRRRADRLDNRCLQQGLQFSVRPPGGHLAE